MIDQLKLDELKRALDQCGSDEKFSVDRVVPGKPLALWEFDLDLLRDLVALAEATPDVGVEDAYKAGYDHGWEECLEEATIDAYKHQRAAQTSWETYKADEKL